jgi:dUTP pyrophosphatase
MERGFEKISLNQFLKDTNLGEKNYDEIVMPVRKTSKSAGYDISILDDVRLEPGETKLVPTGLKLKMKKNEVALVIIRSSIGFKYGVGLANQTGVIDSDYYNNTDNEGHLFVPLHNFSKEKFFLSKNQRFAQVLFVNYLISDVDQQGKEKRKGGFGSTDEKK